MHEGQGPTIYQWRVVDPQDRKFNWISSQVSLRPPFTGKPVYELSGLIRNLEGEVYERPVQVMHPSQYQGYRAYRNVERIICDGRERQDGWAGGTGHCTKQSVYWHERTAWRSVHLAVVEDKDAFNDGTYMIHNPIVVGSDYDLGEVLVPVRIDDDDEWAQDVMFAADDNGSPGGTWTALEDGGLDLAFPASLPRVALDDAYTCDPDGVKTTPSLEDPTVTPRRADWPHPTESTSSHTFWVRLKNDPATVGTSPPKVTFDMVAEDGHNLKSGLYGAHSHHKVLFTTSAHTDLTSLGDSGSRGGSVTVTYTPVKINIYVGHCIEAGDRMVEISRTYDRGTKTFTSVTETQNLTADLTFRAEFYRLYWRDAGGERIGGFDHRATYASTATAPGSSVITTRGMFSPPPPVDPPDVIVEDVVVEEVVVDKLIVEPPQDQDDPGYTIDPTVIAKVRTLAAQTHHGTAHVNRWERVLAAFGELDPETVNGGSITLAEARQNTNRYSSPVWDLVVTELTALEASQQDPPQQDPPQQDPPQDDPGYTVDPDVIAKVRALAAQTHHGAAHVNRWERVLAAFGELDPETVSGGSITLAEAQQNTNRYSSPVWDLVVTELTALEASQ